MRVTARVPLPPGMCFDGVWGGNVNPAQLPEVRDPSLPHPVGRVAAVEIEPDALVLHLDLDDALVTARLAEYRPVF